jgi:hypothetical protein
VSTVRANVIVGNVFLGIGAVIGIWVGGIQADRLMTWRPVQATIVACDVQAVKGGRGGVGYLPVASYNYAMNGQQYQATGVTVLRVSSSYKWAQALCARYAHGLTVTAYIDPKNPRAGYLEHRFGLLPFWFLIGGLVLRTMFAAARAPTRMNVVLNEDGTVASSATQ